PQLEAGVLNVVVIADLLRALDLEPQRAGRGIGRSIELLGRSVARCDQPDALVRSLLARVLDHLLVELTRNPHPPSRLHERAADEWVRNGDHHVAVVAG